MRRFVALLLACSLSMAASAQPAGYPQRPVRLLVGFAAGGSVDTAARILAEGLRSRLPQPVVVENRPGASGLLAGDTVARSEPDGLTLFFTSNGALTITPHLVSKSPFQPLSDFAPITRVAQVDAVLVTHPSIPATDFRSFLALVKAAPGKFAFASSGNGGPTHLAGELLKRDAGIELLHVPYKGDSPALVDIMGGAIAFGIPVIPSAAPFIKSGRLRALASFGEHRLPDFPDVPTIAESGYPSVSAGAWYAVVAPAKTPAAIVTLLNERISATLADPEVARKLVAAGMQPSAASTPGATASYIKSEYDKWGALIRSARIEPIN